MPLKWTPENDQILLLKILETSNVAANKEAIALAWPKDRGDIPTPRAIQERLVKIRTNCIASGGGHFTIMSNKSGGKPSKAPPSTPLKSRAIKEGNAAAVKKEKAAPPDGQEASYHTSVAAPPSASKRKRSDVKVESDDDDIYYGSEDLDAESPQKKVKNLVKQEDEGY